MFKTILIGIILTIVCLVTLTFIDPKVTTNNKGNANISNSANNLISVTIRGEVVHEGTYVMEKNDVLDDLVNAAGGTTNNADMKAFNSNCPLEDDTSYYIARKDMESDACIKESISKVNINKATKEQLMTINGIGSAIATAIVDYRQANGQFYRIEDLMKVSGIGNATFEKIKDYVTLS